MFPKKVPSSTQKSETLDAIDSPISTTMSSWANTFENLE